MASYNRITFEERAEIYHLKQLGNSNISIAKILGKNKSSIGRELTRNKHQKLGYLPDSAHFMTKKRKCRDPKISRNAALFCYIKEKLEIGWSPQQISGRLRRDKSPQYVCHETIYKYIYCHDRKLANLLAKKRYCRVKQGRKSRKSNIPNMVRISQRATEISSRKTVGHWEGDLVIFTILRSSNVATLVERKTRYNILIHNKNKYSETVIGNIANQLKKMDKTVIKSVTFDRGSEFASHEKLHKHQVDTYFCNPASPWQKGGNENFNGRLRRYLPKNFDHRKLSQDLLDEISKKMNDTPRKCLNYKTPNEALKQEIIKGGCNAK
jgi:IS30 family transposase